MSWREKIYTALYRKWRPQNFEEVKGQEHITKTLANAVKTSKIAHAYLFVGPRGVGKTSVARIFAKALNCEKGPTPIPCNVCNNCTKITKGISLDVIEIDGASNRGIDQIRELKERIKFSPVEGRYKIYIIDEVHMLTNEAFNALLKTLEEPPSHVIFIFATTDPQKLPLTILSRCQRFDFKKLSPGVIKEGVESILKSEGINFEEEATYLISQAADGSMRDALSILEQVIAYTEGHITYRAVLELLGMVGEDVVFSILNTIKTGKKEEALKIIDEVLERGVDIQSLYLDIIKMLRNLMFYMVGGEKILDQISDVYIEKLNSLSRIYKPSEVEILLDRFISFETQIKTSVLPKIILEFLLFFTLEDREDANIEEKISTKEEEKSNGEEKNKYMDYSEQDLVSLEYEVDASTIWETFLTSLKNRALENSLRSNVKSYRFEDNKFILDVPQEMVFYLEEKKKLLEVNLREILKKNIKVVFSQIEQKEEENHRLLKEAIKIFGGRIIDLRQNG